MYVIIAILAEAQYGIKRVAGSKQVLNSLSSNYLLQSVFCYMNSGDCT